MSIYLFRIWRKSHFGAARWISNNNSKVANLIVTLYLCVVFACSGPAWVPSWFSSFHPESPSMSITVSGNNTLSMGVTVDCCVSVGPAFVWQLVQVVPFLSPPHTQLEQALSVPQKSLLEMRW